MDEKQWTANSLTREKILIGRAFSIVVINGSKTIKYNIFIIISIYEYMIFVVPRMAELTDCFFIS